MKNRLWQKMDVFMGFGGWRMFSCTQATIWEYCATRWYLMTVAEDKRSSNFRNFLFQNKPNYVCWRKGKGEFVLSIKIRHNLKKTDILIEISEVFESTFGDKPRYQ